MRVAILLLCIVVLAEGVPIGDGDRRELMNLLRKLETISGTLKSDEPIVNEDDTYPHLPEVRPMPMPISPVDLKPYIDKLFKIPVMEDPWTFDLDRLYEFPGGNFMTEMMEKIIFNTGPLRPEMMDGFPVEGPPYMHWFLQSMQPQWTHAMMTFYGDWTGLPELFTRKLTMFALEVRKTCPSVFFDMFVARWSYGHMKEIFSTEDTGMANVFLEKFAVLFPNRDSELKPMAIEAAFAVHGWVTAEITQHIYGSGMQDVARFSHIIYQMMRHYFETSYDKSFTPFKPSSLEDMVYPAWYHAAVRCENGTEVLARYSIVMEVFRRNYERLTDNYILGEVEMFLSKKAYENGVDFSSFNDDVMRDVAECITDYVDETMGRLEDLLDMMSPATGYELMEFFQTMQFPLEEENGFVREMFYRLNIPIASIPERSNPVENPMGQHKSYTGDIPYGKPVPAL